MQVIQSDTSDIYNYICPVCKKQYVEYLPALECMSRPIQHDTKLIAGDKIIRLSTKLIHTVLDTHIVQPNECYGDNNRYWHTVSIEVDLLPNRQLTLYYDDYIPYIFLTDALRKRLENRKNVK